MKIYEIETEIEATPEDIWRILTKVLPSEPAPFGILRFEGEISLGSRLKLWSEVSPKQAFKLKVDKFSAPNEMVWKGGMPVGLFIGTRTFSVRSTQHGAIFHMKEVFSGPLAWLITKSIPDLTPSFEKFAATLKQKAEQT